MSETVNPAPAGNDSPQPSAALDNPANWQFDDEPEEANTVEETPGTDPESETDEPVEAAQESEEPEQEESTTEDAPEGEEAEGDESQKAAVKLTDDAFVELPNGEVVKAADLTKGRMLERDYRLKTAELGNKSRDLEATTSRIQGTIEAFTNFLAEQLPPEPQPALALQNPNEYTKQKAVYEAAMAQVQALIELGTQTTEVSGKIDETKHREALEQANEKLLEVLPFLTDPGKRKAFNKTTYETALHFGYSQEELNRVTDHRLLWLGHYAAKGLEAEKAKAKVAQKIQNVPPPKTATPVKRATTAETNDFVKQKEALRRLNKSGSIHDAVKVDWD